MRKATAVVIAYLAATGFVSAATEPIGPTKDLEYDIAVLGHIIKADLSGFELPEVRITPATDFDAMIAKIVAEARGSFVKVGERAGYTHEACENTRTLIEISDVFPETAASLAKPLDPRDYFRIVRIHELFHWASCMIGGEDRFFAGARMAWNREEGYANAVERRFAREQLGKTIVTLSDYELPPHPFNMAEGTLPHPRLHKLHWRQSQEGGDEGFVAWDTANGETLMVRVYVAKSYEVKFDNPALGGTLKAQHLPGYNETTQFELDYWQLVIHQGRYVGFERFMVPDAHVGEAFARGAVARIAAWYDAGYAPSGADGGKPPDAPFYAGYWVQVYPQPAPRTEKK